MNCKSLNCHYLALQQKFWSTRSTDRLDFTSLFLQLPKNCKETSHQINILTSTQAWNEQTRSIFLLKYRLYNLYQLHAVLDYNPRSLKSDQVHLQAFLLPFLINVNFSCPFSNSFFSDTSSSPRSRCFHFTVFLSLPLSLFFIITLNLTTITLRPVKRENQLNSHFLLHRLPFYVSFFSFCCLFIISLVGLLDCITFFLDVCTFVFLFFRAQPQPPFVQVH